MSISHDSAGDGHALGTAYAPVRGEGHFDAELLREALAALPPGQAIDPAKTDAYRGYYGLDFGPAAIQHIMFGLSHGEHRLAVQHFLPERAHAYAVLCHGYYDHVGLFGHVIDYLLARGVAVVTFDQIGHGLSSGAPATIDSFDHYVAATRAVYVDANERLSAAGPHPWHWFGQSMGGAVVMEYLHQHRPPEGVGEIVLLAPLVRPHAWWFNRWVFALAKRTITERVRTLTENAENPEFHALQAADPLQARVLPVAWVQAMVDWFTRFEQYPPSDLSVKLLQGDDDKTVDWRYNLKVYERRYPHSEHLIIHGGRHHLANESSVLRIQMWRFLDQHCSW